MRAPALPKEHGGWAMLYAPLIVGGVRGGVVRPDLVGIAAGISAAYLARAPATALLARRVPARAVARWLAVCAAVFLASALWLAWHPRRSALLALVGIGVVVFVLHSVLFLRREDRSATGELLGIAGLCLSAPIGYVAAMGASIREAAVLWALCVLFFGSSVFYVKWRVRRLVADRKGGNAADAAVALIAYHVVLLATLVALAAGGLTPWGILWAFAPLLLRYFLPLIVRDTPTLIQIGVSEIILSLAFVLALLAAY